MALELVEDFDVTNEFAKFKFGITPMVKDLTNSIFKVYTDSATPTELTDPFLPLDLVNNYNSISKVITIYWKSTTLQADTAYKIVIHDYVDAAGNIIPDGTYRFTTGSSVVEDVNQMAPTETVIDIEDHSIKSQAFSNIATVIATNPDFNIQSIDPVNQDIDLPADYNNGQIAIKFSSLPNGLFLNNNYFKVQKKKIQRSPSRWQVITANIIGDSSSGTVYINLPSTDATPVFGVAGKIYFEPQYKYRVIISKEVGA